jgi:hypothetical protein
MNAWCKGKSCRAGAATTHHTDADYRERGAVQAARRRAKAGAAQRQAGARNQGFSATPRFRALNVALMRGQKCLITACQLSLLPMISAKSVRQDDFAAVSWIESPGGSAQPDVVPEEIHR